eukprot:c46036_g1_i1.p1 GENE.c46036_g1_i1~~c46036_g1_i1.p1  ORF type:complete len:497 (+),score=119.45 c46036_g1_i1:185-1492(+)
MFQQRFYVNDLYFSNPEGPIFLYLSGEAPLYGPPAKNSHIDLLAQRHKALLIGLEHRYYGQSIPFDKLTTHHLKFLNVRQALLDTAAFVMFYQGKLDELRMASISQKSLQDFVPRKNKWVMFGGSYAGALAAWTRSKFPDLISGAVVSSAVVNVIRDFSQFDAAIGQTVGVQCGAVMRRAADDVDLFLTNNDQDNAFIKNMFNASSLEDGDFRFMIADAMAMAVQYGYKERICEPLQQSVGRGRMALLQALQRYMNEFFYPTLEQNGALEYSATFLQNEDVDEEKCGRQWWYQKCSELGFFQIAPPKDSVRSPLINKDYHRQLCSKVFGQNTVWPDDGAVNAYFGGLNLKTSRVFFANGGEDPWRVASFTRESTKLGSDNKDGGELSDAGLPAEVAHCIGCGHCVDMKQPKESDPDQLVEIRDDIDRYLTSWLES